MIDEDSFVSSFLDIPLSPSYDSMFILDDDDLLLLPSSDDPLHHQISQELTTDEWTRDEDKQFENAIAEFSDKINSSELFAKIASRVPGKTIDQIEKHYRMLVEDIDTIESGRCPIPEYLDSKIADDDADDDDIDVIDLVDDDDDDDDDDDESLKQDKKKKKKEKKKKGKEGPRRFRRKGVPWTDEEHSLFLEGLSKYGKGDWRSISRYYVITKTPTQVASHAQKYYLRLNSAKNNIADQGTKCQSTLQIPGHQPIYQQQITNNNLINVNYANLPMAAMDLPNFSNMYGNATGHYGPIAPPPPPPPPPPFPLQVSPAMNYQQQPLGGTSNYDFAGNSWVLNNCAFPSPASFAPNNPVLLPPAMNSVAMPPAPAYNSFGEGSYYPAQGYPMNNMMNSTNNYLQPFSYPPTYPSFPGQFPNGPE